MTKSGSYTFTAAIKDAGGLSVNSSVNVAVNQTVFAIDRAETLEEFGGNEVSPYFDRYDLHHYIALPQYPRAYARHRAVSGGLHPYPRVPFATRPSAT